MSEPSKLVTTEAMSKIDLQYLVRALVKYNASDLHIKVGRPPLFRIHGKLVPAKMPAMKQATVESVLYGTLTPQQIKDLETHKQIDFSFRVADLGRFRCNIYYQRGSLSAAVRKIPNTIPSLETLGLPPILKELSQRPRGIILITGATGSGKSTTLASVIQHVNETRPVHVLAIEDPIEFLFKDQKASITQREIGTDATSMKDALIAGLRQDPDIIMLGELREMETIQAALTAAETGHLVFATLHTTDAKNSINRILDVFKSEAQNQIRIQLASCLVGVLSQQLIPKADGTGQVLAVEVMVNSPAIEGYIRKNEIDKIDEAIANSNNYYHMQTMNQTLEKLVTAGTIKLEDAVSASSRPDDLKLKLSGLTTERGDGFSNN